MTLTYKIKDELWDNIVTSNREFIHCDECEKDMQGVMEYENDFKTSHRPIITCMKCYYKDEIDDLEK